MNRPECQSMANGSGVIKGGRQSAILVILLSALLVVLVTPQFLGMRTPDVIRPGPGVTQQTLLSAYFPALAGGHGDTPVYILKGSEPGGTLLVLGGTHPDEPAGYMTAVLLVEQARVQAGRLIVIPRANASAFTHNFPQEGHPQRYAISTPHGPRTFRFGARVTNPVDQWPDPQVYVHAASGQALSGIETRNLNRAYPGRPDGTHTERVAHAIVELIRREHVDLGIDLHEAAPEYPVLNTIVTHEKAQDLGALVKMNMEAQGITIGLEASPKNLHGLSHREWGDHTSAWAALMETTQPAMGRLRGRTDAELALAGKDKYYVLAANRGRLQVPFTESGWPLAVRVARHLTGVREFANNLGDLLPDKKIVLSNLPEYQTLVDKGVGAFLN